MSVRLDDIKDEELVGWAREKYNFHTAAAKKFKLFIDAYEAVFEPQIITTEEFITISSNGSERKTFEETIISILNDGKPKTAKMLFEIYSKMGLKPLSLKDFSSKLSMRAKNGKIKNQKIEKYPIDQRYWWGIGEWFKGDNLKDEFLAKVHNYMKTH